MLRSLELDILKGIVKNIGSNCDKLPPDDPLTGFMAMVGEFYNRELMVVGRAVNGWAKGLIPRMLNEPDNREEFVQGVFESVTTGAKGESCPMRWVSQCWENKYGYNTRKSAFWRVIRGIVKKLAIADVEKEEWPSYLIWSNLYKIAPANGGNPSNTLCDLQYGGCKCLLLHELYTFIPKRLLCLTGKWASPFLEGCLPGIKPMSGYDYVEANGAINLSGTDAIKVVVAAHPQGKTEDVWVGEVADAFKLIEERR